METRLWEDRTGAGRSVRRLLQSSDQEPMLTWPNIMGRNGDGEKWLSLHLFEKPVELDNGVWEKEQSKVNPKFLAQTARRLELPFPGHDRRSRFDMSHLSREWQSLSLGPPSGTRSLALQALSSLKSAPLKRAKEYHLHILSQTSRNDKGSVICGGPGHGGVLFSDRRPSVNITGGFRPSLAVRPRLLSSFPLAGVIDSGFCFSC